MRSDPWNRCYPAVVSLGTVLFNRMKVVPRARPVGSVHVACKPRQKKEAGGAKVLLLCAARTESFGLVLIGIIVKPTAPSKLLSRQGGYACRVIVTAFCIRRKAYTILADLFTGSMTNRGQRHGGSLLDLVRLEEVLTGGI